MTLQAKGVLPRKIMGSKQLSLKKWAEREKIERKNPITAWKVLLARRKDLDSDLVRTK